MDRTVSLPRNSSLDALRGAVGEVVGDGVGRWDRMLSLWRIFTALDALMAVLWGIVHRIAAGEIEVDGHEPVGAVAVRGMRPGVAGPVRVRIWTSRLRPGVSGIAVVAERRGTTADGASGAGVLWDVGSAETPSMLADEVPRFSNRRLGALENCAHFVPVCLRYRRQAADGGR
jgi:hypothetical protein